MMPTDKELLKRNKELISITESTAILLNGSDFGSALEIVLDKICLAFEINHLLLFGLKKKDNKASTDFKLFAHSDFTKISDQSDAINEFAGDLNLERHIDQLSKGHTIKEIAGNLLTTMRHADHPLYKMQVLVMPVFATNVFWGALVLVQQNQLTGWNENSEKNLKNLTVILGGALHQQKNSEVLADALHIAKDANRAKFDFMTTISHKIRTPMNGVIGMAELLAQTNLTPSQHQYVHIMETCNETMMATLNDMLDYSKIESGKLNIEEDTYDLRLLMEDVIELLSHSAYEKKLGIHYFIDPTLQTNILGDKARVKQVLINLIGNAIKFTDSGEIVVTVERITDKGKDMDICISVKDTGNGMSASQLEDLSGHLHHSDSSTSSTYNSSALGLIISARLAGLMQGGIIAESMQGEGSTFHFSFHAKVAEHQEGKNVVHFPDSALPAKNVLIALSEVSSAHFMARQFRHWGMNPVCVSDLEDAKQKVKSNSIDLLVISKQKMDETEPHIITALRDNNNGSAPPLLMITPAGFVQHTHENTSPVEFTVTSPVKLSDLVEAICKIFMLHPALPKVELTGNEAIADKKLSSIYPMRILVADDNVVNQRIMLKVFKIIGYAVDLASDGIEVLECIDKTKYDLIMMDMQMPLMDGYETTSTIRAQKSKPQPLIIAMTANTMSGAEQECLDCGMDDYISKPIVIDDIRNIISKWGHYTSIALKKN